MSASIIWEPVKFEGGYIVAGSGGWIRDALQEVFGDLPREFTEDHIPQLKAMQAVSRDDSRPFAKIIEKIELYTTILISVSY